MGEVIYKEITPYPEIADRWNDITINSGASQRTLDDIKLPETAGCFTYSGDRKHIEGTSNRFIYWRTFNDVVELVEVSLDVNLRGNCLRLHFERSPILQGLSIHEMADQVVILLATVSTVHRLNFPHPRKMGGGEDRFWKQTDAILPSIFFDASLTKIYDHSSFYVLNHTMSPKVPLPHTSCSWLMPSGQAAFVLANRLGSHLLVVMGEHADNKVVVTELKRASVMSRLWNGLVRNSQSGEVALNIVCHQEATDAYIFSLCRDLRIRMWSQRKQECLMCASVFEQYEENSNIISGNFSAQQCYMKKSVCSSSSSDYFLGVYISQPPRNQFFILQPLYIADQYRLSHIATLHHEKHDLVDFCVSLSHVWTLWLNAQSEPVVMMTPIESDENTPVRVPWLTVDLQPPVSRDVFMPVNDMCPKDAYLREVFCQGRFSPATVSKVINIYRRTADISFSFGSPSIIGSLREEAVKAVENEIFVRTRDADLTEEEKQELEIECWDKFFSYCIQYHEVGTKPLGLAFDPDAGYAIIIKKHIYSLLCPCDTVEQLILSRIDGYNPLACSLNPIVREDATLSVSILAIFHCMSILKKQLTEDMMVSFEHDLYQLRSPDQVAEDLIREMEAMPGDAEGGLLMKLQSQLQMATNLSAALKFLLKKVDLSQRDDMFDMDDVDVVAFTDYPYFLSGNAGISVLCEGMSQFAGQRFLLCRDLLLLELLMVKIGESGRISPDMVQMLESDVIPATRLLVQAYFALKWCTECEFTAKQSFLESGLKQLSLIDVPDVSSWSKYSGNDIGKTIVYYFIVEMGRKEACSLLASQIPDADLNCKNWTLILPRLITNLARLLWPLGPHFQFPEFLLSQCQYTQLQSYVHLLEHWCEWHAYSRKFLSANCFLIVGEPFRALQLFVQVAESMDKEEYVHNKIMQGIDDCSISPTAQYYLKVIQMFEQYELSDCIINLANTVIGILDRNDPQIPTFWSLVFKHHLELGNSEEAFAALTRNPDPSRQKDCLRQMIVVLCERRKYHTLVEFPYMNMQDEVVTILESRARSSDLLKQDFYDLLYAFHIKTNNYRKAASILYEYAMRLGQEVNSLDGLRKQASCYLIALHCLALVDPKYAWIATPIPKISNGLETENPGMSPKRDVDGEEIPFSGNFRKIEVVEIPDIIQEHTLIRARLMLAERDPSPSNMAATPLSASDCVTLLISAGLFDAAIKLCKTFSLPLTPIFEGLTYRCVKLLQLKSFTVRDNEKLLDWLSQNECSICPSSAGLSAREQIWYLLKHYLEEYETEGSTKFHRCVTSRLLSLGIRMPAWLKRSYQVRNSSELLMLYINYGFIENAAEFAIDLINAVLEHRAKEFGILHSLRENSPPIWLPHTYFDVLLRLLQEKVRFADLYKMLDEKLKEYHRKVESVSEAMIMMSMDEMKQF